MGRYLLRQLHGKLHLGRKGFFQRIAIHIADACGSDGERAGIRTHDFQLVSDPELVV